MGLYLKRASDGTYINQDANSDGVIDKAESAGVSVTVTDQTANRTFNTIYQNTTGKTLLVIVGVYANVYAASYCNFYGEISADGSTFTTVSYAGAQDADGEWERNRDTLVIVVPLNYYYRLRTAEYSTAPGRVQKGIVSWIEIEM